MLAAFFSPYNLYRANIFSVPWQIVISSLILDQLPKCYFCFQCRGTSPRVPLTTVKCLGKCLYRAVFCWRLGYGHPFPHHHSSLHARQWPHLLRPRATGMAAALASPQSALSSITPLGWIQILRPALPLFISLLHFHLCWSVLAFVKPHMGSSLRDREATQLHTLLSVCELKNRCPVIGHQQTLKAVVWLSLIMICMHLLRMY